MFKSVILAGALLAQGTQAASSCSMKIEAFSDDTCTTPKTDIPQYPNGVANVDVKFGKCHGVGDKYFQIKYCDPDEFIAIAKYSDDSCKSRDVQKMAGYIPDRCMIETADTWLKVSRVDLTGNKYGMGWKEGWGIFLCQTVLFGVCNGY